MRNDSPADADEKRDEVVARLLRLRERAVAFAFAILRDFHASEDVYQEATVIALRKSDQFQSGSFDAWFWAILRNVLGTQLRKSKGRTLVIDTDLVERLESHFLKETRTAPEEDVDLLIRCLRKLSGTMRTALEWRFLENRSCPDIAGRLGRSLTATYALLKRARKAVKSCVDLHAGSAVEERAP
ncbi:MAG: sigma-70 family RNA polymerase sigma factor [Planctomycetota bacterium]|jgi:RNA polymerase sigma factor (sigma-70 family)